MVRRSTGRNRGLAGLVIGVLLVALCLFAVLRLDRRPSPEVSAGEPVLDPDAQTIVDAGVATSSSSEELVRRPAEEVAAPAAPRPFEELTPEEGEPVRGLVVDDATGFPVPYLCFEVKPSGRPSIPVETDASGRFATPGPVGFGGVLIRGSPALEFPRPWISHAFPGASSSAGPLGVRIGPAFLVGLERSGGVHGLTLVARLRSGFETGLVLDDREVRLPPARDDRPFLVLFSRRARRQVETARLELRDESGAWVGVATVDDRPGLRRHVLAIELVPSGALHGTVRRQDGSPFPNQLVRAIAFLEPPALDATPLFVIAGVARSGPEGEWTLDGLAPGPHLVAFHAYGTGPFARLVEVHPGTRSFVSIAPAEEDARDHTLAGRIVWPADRRPPNTRMELVRSVPHTDLETAWLHRDRERDTSGTLSWTRGAEGWEAEFRFDGLARGEYRLRPESRHYGFDPRERVVAPSAWDVDFTCLPGEVRDLGIRVVDGVTGAPVEGATFGRPESLHSGEPPFHSVARGVGEILVQDVPLRATWVAAVHAPGYAERLVSHGSFAAGTELLVPLVPRGVELDPDPPSPAVVLPPLGSLRIRAESSGPVFESGEGRVPVSVHVAGSREAQ